MVFSFGFIFFINCLLCNLKLSLSIMYVFINLRGFFYFVEYMLEIVLGIVGGIFVFCLIGVGIVYR